MKKFIIILLSVMLIFSLFTGCGSKNEKKADTPANTNDNKTTTEKKETKKDVEPKVNEFGWEVPDKTIEISYFAGKGNPDKVEKNSKIINQYLLENFNVKLNKIVYDTDQSERLNLMLASNEYPDVITGLSSNEVSTWIDLGKAVELTPLIDKYGSTIKEKYGDIYNRYKDADGKVYYLERGWGFLPIPDNSAHLRWDWWKAMGSPKIETPDDYYNVLKQMQSEHPTNSEGEQTYAISAYKWENSYNTLLGIWGLKEGYKEDSNHNLTHWINTDEGLKMTKYINRFYRENLLDPDSFINTYDDWKAKFSAERIMGHIGAWWVSWNAGHEVWQKTKDDWTDDMRYVQIKVKAPEAEKAYFSAKNTTGWSRTIITDKCKQPENVVKWWNFEISDMGTRLLGWGPPNLEESVWNLDGTNWSWKKDAEDGIVNGTWDYDRSDKIGQYMHWIVMGQGLMNDGKSNIWFDQNFNDKAKWKKIMNDNLRDTIYDFSAFKSVKYSPDDPVTVIKQQIKDMLDAGWADAVTADTEQQCEQKFSELRDKLNKAGLEKLQTYVTQQYKKNLDAWK